MYNLRFDNGDKVKLLNGRIAKVLYRIGKNTYYYNVETYDNEGKRHVYKAFVMDMILIERSEHNGNK